MRRQLPFCYFILGLLLGGCGKSETAALNPAEPAVSADLPSPAKAPSKVEPQPTASAKPTAAEPVGRELARGLLESDGQGGWRKNEKAATELEKLTPEQVQELWTLLEDSDAAVRRGVAVHLLPLLDPASSEQVAAFKRELDDADGMVRARAIDAARQFQKADQVETVPRLAAFLDAAREERPENRVAAARLCASLKRDAEGVAPDLIQAAKNDPEAKVRAAALAALAQVTTMTPAVLEALQRGLGDKESSVRLVATNRLRQVGGSAAPAAPALAHALEDADPAVAENAAQALVAIGARSVEPLSQQLAGGNPAARKLALAALAALGPAARPALPSIEQCTQDADPQVRQLAEAALARIKTK